MREADRPQSAFDRANALLEQAASQVHPTGRVVALHVIAIIADLTFRRSGLEHDSVKNQVCALRAQGHVMLTGERNETGDQACAEFLVLAGCELPSAIT